MNLVALVALVVAVVALVVVIAAKARIPIQPPTAVPVVAVPITPPAVIRQQKLEAAQRRVAEKEAEAFFQEALLQAEEDHEFYTELAREARQARRHKKG